VDPDVPLCHDHEASFAAPTWIRKTRRGYDDLVRWSIFTKQNISLPYLKLATSITTSPDRLS
jgi:hypothetical protein